MPQIKLTPIKPKRLNEGAMRAQLLLGLKRIGLDIRQNFESTVDTWRRKPVFEPYGVQVQTSGNIAKVETLTESEVYRWVSKGTKPHKIVPVNVPQLVFPGTFTPKTKPGTILAGPGFSGPPIEYRGAEGVNHPGVEAREFEKQIKDRELPHTKHIMELAMAQARRASGHAYP